MTESDRPAADIVFDPAAPAIRYDLGPVPDVGAANSGGDLFPVTAADLIPLADIVDKTVTEWKNTPNPQMTLQQLFHEKLADHNPSPTVRFCAGMIFNTRLLPGSGLHISLSFNSGRSAAITAVVPWLNHVDDTRRAVVDHAEANPNAGDFLRDLFYSLYDTVPPDERYPLLRTIIRGFMTLDPEASVLEFELPVWLARLKTSAADNEHNLTDYFKVAYEASSHVTPKRQYRLDDVLDVADIARAWRQGILPTNDSLRLLMLHGLTDPVARHRLAQDCPELAPALDRAVDAVVKQEIRRGEEPTPVTDIATRLAHFEGAENFADILAALGDEPADLGARYSSSDYDKRIVLSRLQAACYPAPGDTLETLAPLLRERNVSRARLSEAMTLAPQWKTMVEQYMKDNLEPSADSAASSSTDQLKLRYADWLKPCRKSAADVFMLFRRRFTLEPAACPTIESVRLRIGWSMPDGQLFPEDKMVVSGYRVVNDGKSRLYYGNTDEPIALNFAVSELCDVLVANGALAALAAVERGISKEELDNNDEARLANYLHGLDVLHRIGDNDYLAARRKEIAATYPFDYPLPAPPPFDPAVNYRLALPPRADGNILLGDFIAAGAGTARDTLTRIAYDSITVTGPDFEFVFPAREEVVPGVAGESVRFEFGIVPGIPFSATCTVTSDNLRLYSENLKTWIPARLDRRVRTHGQQEKRTVLREKYAALATPPRPPADPIPYLQNTLGLTLRAVPLTTPPWPDNALHVFHVLTREPERTLRKDVLVYELAKDAKSAPYYDDREDPKKTAAIYLYQHFPTGAILTFSDLLDAEITVARGPASRGRRDFFTAADYLIRRGMMTPDGRRIIDGAAADKSNVAQAPAEAPFPPPGEPLNLDDMMARAARLEGRRRDIADYILERVRNIVFKSNETPLVRPVGPNLRDYLDWRDGMTVEEVFRPGDDVYETVATLAGPENAAVLRHMWVRTSEYPWFSLRWSNDDSNPRYRSKRLGLFHIGDNIGKLSAYLGALAKGFSLEDYLKNPEPWDNRDEPTLPSMLAVRMDEGDGAEEIFTRIKTALFTKIANGGGRGSIRDLVGALVRSRRPEAGRLLADLLADPMLPEQYRLDILNLANQGTFASFNAIVNDDRQYTSTTDGTFETALVSWIGMETVISGVYWGERGIGLLRDSMDMSEKRKAFSFRDTNDYTVAYLGLWALAQRDLDAALEQCRKFFADGSRNQKLSGLFWLTRLRNMTLRIRLLMPLLEDKTNWGDGLIMALIFRCFGIDKYYVRAANSADRDGWGMYPVILKASPGEMDARHDALYCTEAELRRLRAAIQGCAATLDGPEDRPFGGQLWVFYHRYHFLFFKQDLLNLDKALMRR